MDQNSEDGNGRGFRGGVLAMTLAGALALYVFMLGPAAHFYDSCPEPVQTGIEYIYIPLQMLDEQIPGQPFTWYVDLWT